MVAAPTGSGKTVVAEYGIEMMRRLGKRAFYTAPLKALSNQKFRDLGQRYGVGQVGLLTGDNVVDGDAPTVVMTTEVLRNMIYARSAALDDLGLVVLDEVHFLQDAYRGPVWEEVIIHLPSHVRLVCLSATVSNSGELAAWIETVRGATTAVVETRRPVRLDDHYLVGDRTNDRLQFLPTFVNGMPNPDASRIDALAVRGRGSFRRPARGSGQRVLYTPGRLETIDLLAQRSLLPAIFFIFSRNQCDEAARAAAAGVRLTTAAEREAIRAIVDQRLGALDDADLAVLGYGELVAGLEAGVAPHHAGMVPAFKETVEQCFAAGLLKVVFATETLAVGVNMPARTVVIEKLTKFTGDHHEMLTAGEYTQLTGRAGRRGIDDVGQAVVLWSPFVSFERVAELASSRAFHLRSAFRPTYNMAANLVRAYSAEQAHRLLNRSFAQYQSDRDVVRLEARRERLQARLDEQRALAISPLGDIWEYRAERDAERRRGHDEAESREAALAALRPGDVVNVSRGRSRGPAVMVVSATRKAGTRLTVITEKAETLMVTADEVVGPVVAIGRVRLPATFEPHSATYRRATSPSVSLGPSCARRAGAGRGGRRGRRAPGHAPGRARPRPARPHARGGAGRASRAGARRPRPPRRRSSGVARAGVRPSRRRPRPARVHRPRRRRGPGLGVDPVGGDARQHLPRVRPARRRMPAPRLARRRRGAGARRAAVDVRVRAPQSRATGPAVVPERRRTRAMAPGGGHQRGPRRRRAGGRPGTAPTAGRRLLRRRPRLDGRARPRGGGPTPTS